MSMLNGFVIVDKPAGMTSAKIVGKLKHILVGLGEKNTKIGHFGTLDPDGEGVLPIALGRAVRLFSYQEGKEKVYQTEFKFGIQTDTLDCSGTVLNTSDRLPTLLEVQNAANEMIGTSLQIPPLYSAKSVDGKRAYELARKGVEVNLKPKEIKIFRFEAIELIESNIFRMIISVSAGTYIRSIARDMGERLGTFCSMKYIKRLKSGVFELKDSVKPEALRSENFRDYILPIEYFLTEFERVDVPEELSKILLTGSEIYGMELPEKPFSVYLLNRLIGIGVRTEENKLRIKTWLL